MSRQIVDLLQEREPMRLHEIAQELEHDQRHVGRLLCSLLAQGRARRVRRGLYEATGRRSTKPNSIGPRVRALLWLYLLVGVRRSELLRIRWEDIDWTEGREALRLERTKSGRLQIVPLSAPAVAILQAVERVPRNPYVFAGTKPGRPIGGLDKYWKRARKRAGLQDVRLHDLRRTVGSWLAMNGTSIPVIQAVLGHSNVQSTMVYARLNVDPQRLALEAHANRIMKAAGRQSPVLSVVGG